MAFLTAFMVLTMIQGLLTLMLCYDYAFTPLVEHHVEKALIVTKQDYMNAWDPWKYVKKDS
jgi:hypothetical protein